MTTYRCTVDWEQPTSLWWLSFAGKEGFRGAYLCLAPSDMAAHLQCGLDECNPGGECLFLETWPEAEVPDALRPFMRRLLSKGEIVNLDRVMGGDGTLLKPTDLDDNGQPREERPQ